MKQACEQALAGRETMTWLEAQIALHDFRSRLFPSDLLVLIAIAEAARDFVWEPENWEAYQDSKASNSAAWPPEFLLLAQTVEHAYGPMPIGAEVETKP